MNGPPPRSLHPLQLFHVGVVAEDIDAAMAEMSASLGVTWLGGEARTFDLVLGERRRTLSIRVADTIGTGLRRVLGAAGSESGYFLTPAGLYIEIISRATRDRTAERLAPQPVAG